MGYLKAMVTMFGMINRSIREISNRAIEMVMGYGSMKKRSSNIKGTTY